VHTVSVMTDGAGNLEVLVHAAPGQNFVAQEEAIEEELDPGPSPITPEVKELLWSGGAFLVFLVLMRLWLVPKVKAGMRARYGKVRSELEEAEATQDAAREEVAQYEGQLATVRAEARERIDAARVQLDGERFDRVAEANEAIAERRSQAATAAEEARIAARGSVEDAAVAVAVRIVELSTGRRPDEGAVRTAVADLTSAGARS